MAVVSHLLAHVLLVVLHDRDALCPSTSFAGDVDCCYATAASDDGFISDDGSDWRAQVERQQRESHRCNSGRDVDLHLARIDAGLDPGAGADDVSEDDANMQDAPALHSMFVDSEAGDGGHDMDDEAAYAAVEPQPQLLQTPSSGAPVKREIETEVSVERMLNRLFSTGRDDVGFDELWRALRKARSMLSRAAVEEALDAMEAANKVVHREGRVHLI